MILCNNNTEERWQSLHALRAYKKWRRLHFSMQTKFTLQGLESTSLNASENTILKPQSVTMTLC